LSWIFFAFASAVFSGLTAILAKIGIKNVDSNLATAIRTIVIVVFAWTIVFIVGSFNQITDINAKTLIFLILSGLATGGSWLFYFKALQIGDVNKVTPVDKSSVVLTMVLGIILLGESFTLLKFGAIVGIALGTYLMAISKKTESKEFKPQQKGNSWLIYALLSAVFASLTAILGKVGIQDVESNLGTAIRTIVVAILAWAIVVYTGKIKQIKDISPKSLKFLILSGFTTGLAWLSFYRALQTGPASVVVPIDKLSIILSVTFAFMFLGEKLTLRSFSGLIIIVMSTILLLI
jgi:transporter family protein